MHRVVVTGFGSITPLGHNAEDSWEGIVAGKTGVAPITRFDTTNFPVKLAAELKDFDPSLWLDRREVRRQDRFEWMANIVAKEALANSGLEVTDANSERIGVSISSGVGGLETFC